ncbi:flagella basal body P-ring formation protein FlgA [Sphingobium sp. AR-3-1]|uniref:Flagella basal body P-ring formation protein FlgA n=1 Tax=Sphingobium psychrophilum TaxID=2728834 RepID=A0A7X9ZQA2_9SPHN|nr:flagella basal body P-ring formation protein FlgA [Sphingobium psychrophilum]NML08753.1 flagella basal body P-ring formation protein FlgA [Sphingobium psychrophilum]
MFRFSPILLAAAALTSVSPALAQAQGNQKFENLDRIDSLVAMTVGANLGEPGGPAAPVDRRLRLAACPTTPSVEGPVFGAAMVQCAALGWRIRVPLVAGASAAASGPVPRYAAAANRFTRAAPVAAKEAVVRKGDPVQLMAGNAVFSVSRMMVADEDGAMGETIRVREDKKSSPIFAQVVQMGVVRIPAFNDF